MRMYTPAVSVENRKITNIASVIVTLLMTAAFAAVWLSYYNSRVFQTYTVTGAAVTILVWLLLYLKFAQVYRAFKIASGSITDTAFSQFLSIAFADFIVYLGGCLFARSYINILPGLITVLIQVFLGARWAFRAKNHFLTHVPPLNCILLYDDTEQSSKLLRCSHFVQKLESYYGHLFRIMKKYPVKDSFDETCAAILPYPVVIIYDMDLDKRSKIIDFCVNAGKRLYITPTLEDIVARGYEVKHFIDTPLMCYNGFFKTDQSYPGKRMLDIIVSLGLLLLTSPLMIVTAIAIKWEDGGDILFRQARCTQGGKVFNILKFRSMVMDAESDGKPRPYVPGDPRVTRVGRFIRATRIDELPQIINILKGDISLVGPRPERVEHMELYTKELPEFRYRLRVKGGLTGYAQIYGKYNTSAHDKLFLDLLYIEQQSFLLDLKIIFQTVKIMFTPESTEGFAAEEWETLYGQPHPLHRL